VEHLIVKEDKMKISVDKKECFSLTDTQKQVIMNDIHEDEFESDMKRRLQYVLMHKYEQCFDRLKKEWDVKLQSRVKSVPTNPEAYAQLVFSQSDYKCRKMRDEVSE
jgi:hypothetical protein